MHLSLFPRTLVLPVIAAGGATFLVPLPLVARAVLFAGIAVWIFVAAFPPLISRARRLFAPSI